MSTTHEPDVRAAISTATRRGCVLRAFAFTDRMQAQTAARLAASAQGDVPVEGMAEYFIEIAPGNEVFRIADIALKAADVRPAFQIVEREFGLLEFHAQEQEAVLAAGDAVLAHLAAQPLEVLLPQVSSVQVITNVHAYQAQLLNEFRKGSLLIPGRSLLVMELAPAAWVPYAINEAEKHASVTLIDLRAVGRFGRLLLAGTESEITTAREAAMAALRSPPHVPSPHVPSSRPRPTVAVTRGPA